MSTPVAVVLAAGKGTRMRSQQPKVLHEVAGRPMLAWVLDAARDAGCGQILVIVGHGQEDVRRAFADQHDLVWVVQEEQRGTGHALAQAAPLLPEATRVLVLSGDVPLVRARTLTALLEAAERDWGALAVAELDEPDRLGRVLVAPDGGLERIVEHADASENERAIRRINAGLYALRAPTVFEDLERIDTDNAQGELYLTDAVTGAVAAGRPMALVTLDDPAEAFGVNDRRDLARVHRALLDRSAARLMDEGVTVLEPARTAIEPSVAIGADTIIHPQVSLLGTTRIGVGCTIHQGAWIQDSTVADGAVIKPYSVLDGAIVGPRAAAGPFARLRPGAELGEAAAVGNFVEVKNARLGPGAKAGHLTYLGDADIGPRANIGAGVVTCNYDGERKHRTVVGERAFVGSDTMLVAPVAVGDRAVTGAGSVITQDVPEGALGLGRARQRTIHDWQTRRAAANRAKAEKEQD